MRSILITLLLCGFFFNSKAQEIDTLAYDSFMEWVLEYHPMATQAELNTVMGDMEVRTARGGFDPMIYGNLDKKSYNETLYYDKREAGISIPTWAGIELNGSYEQNTGKYLNPESNVPNDGLFTAGASVNLGQGLILDQRRAALRQAQLYQQSTESQRRQMLNSLYLQATDMYWRWALAYSNQEVLKEGVELAEIRYRAVKSSFKFGDVAAIDTVEAFSQLLNRQYKLQAAQNTLFATTQELNTYLWDEEGNPINLNEEIYPERLEADFTTIVNKEELRTMVASHPELQIADFELASLDVERKLKAQQIIPVVKLKYNFLTESLNDFDNAGFFENNYKWGISVYTPLFLRKSRGSLGLAKAKIDFKQNSRDIKEIQLRTKLESELNNLENLNSQILTFEQNVFSLEALLQGEVRRFEIGESSLFLVNAREVSVFDSKLTLNELISKRKIANAKTRYAAGLGFNN
ncbi:TolC family protein [Algoriphagus machipongonensis]|uniref:Outer membrane efflux protein n=1 Tax=Algoriphagus machipongonensis TaxID=388413 RepID=A3HSQ8_9BACT|nr:TolC family protein [Algoriphagus machipongonensis]EAZ82876.1 putative outer membrane efflux protein [Algoriphagus machipongonensis]